MSISRIGRMAIITGAVAIGAMATASQASIVYHEGFDYTLGSDMNNANGWQNQNWSGSYSASVGTGLTYAGLTTTGGSMKIVEGGEFVSLTPATDFYVSALIDKTNNGGRQGIFFQQGWNQAQVVGFGIDGDTLYASDGGYGAGHTQNMGSTIANGTTAMLIAHIDQAAKTITVWDYANPSNTATLVYTNTNAINTLNVFGDYGGTGFIDEITVGTTLADVTPVPEPASLSLLGLGGLLLGRRRRA